jgi:hypothetical protein
MAMLSLLKAVVGVVTLPVDIVADVITLGGSLNDKPETYTGKKCGGIMDNIAEATESKND